MDSIRLSPAILFLSVSLTLSLPVQGDQNDPRLDSLFEALAETTRPEFLAEIENRIWNLWYQHPDPEAQAMLKVGEQLMNAGYYRDALRVFSTLIDQQPEFAEAWNRRATLHYLIGDLPASIEDVNRTLALEPRHFGALSGLGLVYLQQENYIKAREAFEKLLMVHPHSPAARRNLETVLEALRARFI
jgi:tetratricopeptide (TPR) repeat protein